MFRFIGRDPVGFIALLSFGLIISLFGYLAWFHSPLWLNRAGALLIIVGILLVASRLEDWLKNTSNRIVDENFDSIFTEQLKKAQIDFPEYEITEQTSKNLKTKTTTLVNEKLENLHRNYILRIRSLEIILLITGTFLNGFGDYIITLLKKLI